MLEEFTMEEREDKIAWGLSPSKTFTTSSLYKLLQSGGVELRLTKKIWQCKIPLKNKIFLWQAFQNRIQTIQQLKSKRWKGSELCYLCDRLEDINHLLFNFSLAEFVWAIFSEALGWRGQPRNLTDLLNNWLTGKFGVNYRTGLSYFAGLAWALWMTRNKICIQKKFPNKALDTVFLVLSFIHKWTLLMRPGEGQSNGHDEDRVEIR
jgi:hypothetical protein